MTTWLVPRSELSPEQLRAVELPADRHRLICGAPGSGKTLVLVHRAARLRERGNVPPEKFHLFVYTSSLTEYIADGLRLLDLSGDCISTFDSWCLRFHRQHVRRPLPRLENGNTPDFKAIRRAVHAHLARHPELHHRYEFVLVDEAQDLEPDALATLAMSARHVTACSDDRQQLYAGGADTAQLAKALGLARGDVFLLSAFRCSPKVVALAGSLLDTEREREEFRRQTRVPDTEKEFPLLYLAANPEREMARLADIVRTRTARGERVAILVPTKRLIPSVGAALARASLKYQAQEKGTALTFTDDRPMVMTYHSAKGTTFDTVLLPFLNREWFDKFADPLTVRLLFVGITRAVKWAYLSAVAEHTLPVVARLRELSATGQLVVQYDRLKTTSPPPASPPPIDPINQGTDFL